jgi:putative N6-adenine-specific DNA methylase
MKNQLTRGGQKLEAAMAHFGLAARVRGCRAVDVGASTGGFVAVLLRCGAVHVTAVDVGHGQLDAELAADSRVENLEHSDWKTLSLTVAPGPFDFFTVDVSFVAARNMLRGLAFRLRDRAEGVVLVKPQFELPSHLVKGGRVDDPALRERALLAFTKKAKALGFQMLAHIDSPVPGGSGTVEMLAHLRFLGRPEAMPRQGEKKPPRPAPATRPVADGPLMWFAAATPGLEDPLRDEVRRLDGVRDVEAVPGGVEFKGTLAVGMAANLHLRIASRVVVRLGQVKARDFAPLRRQLAALPWARFLPRDRPLRIDVSTSRCRLYHTKALAEALELAVSDRLGALPPRPPRSDDEDEASDKLSRVLLRGEEDRFTVSVDASGDLLHRRGWRLETGRAPLRETLAAGILALCGYDPTLPFLDPMCGSGTIVLEACAAALQRAPGMQRSFAFETWPCFDAETWARLRSQAEAAQIKTAASVLLGRDRDPSAIDIARRNVERAGFKPHIQLQAAAFAPNPDDAPSGLVVINPPYGRRLGQHGFAVRLGRDIGRILAAGYRGWRVGVLSPDAAFTRAITAGLRRPPAATHALRNGGLRVDLLIFDDRDGTPGKVPVSPQQAKRSGGGPGKLGSPSNLRDPASTPISPTLLLRRFEP